MARAPWIVGIVAALSGCAAAAHTAAGG